MPKKGYKQTEEHLRKRETATKKGSFFKCLICEKQFYRRPSDILKGHNKYCSKKCFLTDNPMKKEISVNKYRDTLIRNGTNKFENNPNWKGGITPLNKQIRASNEYKNWRNSVFIRDMYKCQECGAISKKGESCILHAHHIVPFSIDAKLRFELNNGITLCSKCHSKKPKGKEILNIKYE